jgi:DHA1 family bicyclomycin/chloramphenicol resistance-like MFS transporter
MSHAEPKRFWIILILGSLSTISPFAIDMYLPAFPKIALALHAASTNTISLSISSYFAGLAAGQFIYGPLLDRFGRKPPLYAGLVIFIGASLLCACSHSVSWLVTMRFVQALGGCAAQTASMAMVRDFFPVQEMARIISLLILILGVSPLLAPTAGTFIAARFGWEWVFILLAIVAFLNLLVVLRFLPRAHAPDTTVSLRPGPIARNFAAILVNRQFITYSLSGSFIFSGLLVYVAGSPVIFMEIFHVSERTFGLIFAGLSVGFIGSNQINVLLLRWFSSDQIFRGSLMVECPAMLLLLLGTAFGWFGLNATLILLFVALCSLGLAFPNSAALALAPIDRNIGSASAMMGFLQIGISGLVSACIGLFTPRSMVPITALMAATSVVGLVIFVIGRRGIAQLRFVEEKGATPLGH